MQGLFKQVSLWIVLAIIVVLVLTRFAEIGKKTAASGQADFAAQIEANNIGSPVKVNLGENSVRVYVTFKEPLGESLQKELTFTVPEFRSEWEKQLQVQGVEVSYRVENTMIPTMIFQIVLLLTIIGAFWFFMIRQMQNSPRPPGSRTIFSKRGEKATVWDSLPRGAVAEAVDDAIDKNGRAILAGINFHFNGTKLLPESSSPLEGVASYLKNYPYRTFYVVGHTEATSGLDFQLSEDRAQAVVDVLVNDYGIAPERLEAHGVGPLVPLRNNATDDGREKNRRIELVER